MAIGILIVCLSSRKPFKEPCTFVIKSEGQASIGDDSRPYSIAIGDLNGDGLPDLVVPNSGTNNIGVFLRRVNNSFTDQIRYPTGAGSTPYAVAIGDFNRDEHLDVAVANFGSHTIGIFFGADQGIFQDQITFSTGASRSLWIAVGDFNNDARLDIASVNFGTNDVAIFVGDGNGSFARKVTLSTGSDSIPYALALANLNNDDLLDIAVANYGTDNLGIFFGQGNATFTNQLIISTGVNSRPYSITIGDFNKDTTMDIVAICPGTNDLVVFLGFGNGTFDRPSRYATGKDSWPTSVVIGDFNNDQHVDLIVSNYGTNDVSAFFGYGNGRFADRRTYYNNSHSIPSWIDSADFNNDQRPDIAVVNYEYNYIDVLLTGRNYTFVNAITYPSTGYHSSPRSLTIVDIDQNDRPDIIVANYASNNIGTFLNNADGTFSEQAVYSTGDNSGPSAIVHGQLSSDSQPDIVVANYRSSEIALLFGRADGTFSSLRTRSTGTDSMPVAVGLADLNNDTFIDIIVVNSGTDNVAVFLNDAATGFAAQQKFSTGTLSSPSAVAVGDVNNDSRVDMVITNYGTGEIVVFLGDGLGAFSVGQLFSAGENSGPSSIGLRDLNGDSRLDVVVTNSLRSQIVIWLGSGNGSFSLKNSHSSSNDSKLQSVVLADLDKDGQIDIVLVDSQTDTVDVLMGFGDGTFSAPTVYSTGEGSNPLFVGIADLNNDTWLDLAIVDRGSSAIGIRFGSSNATFTTRTMFSTRGTAGPVWIAVGDFDNDQRLDMVVANDYSDNLDVFLGFDNNAFSKRTVVESADIFSPAQIVTGDLNNDSRLDLVIANWAGNSISLFFGHGDGTFSSPTTYSTGTDSQPYYVALGDVNNDTRIDIVVANYGTEAIAVFLASGNGTFSTPLIVSTGNGFQPIFVLARDLNKDHRLDIAVVKDDLAQVDVFFGHGDGTFAQPISCALPIGSGPNSLASDDLDNDGDLDFVVTMYFRGAIAIFFNYGNGSFTTNPVIYSTGSGSRPYMCVTADFNQDGQLDIVVTNCRTNDIVLLVGRGDGTFSKDISYSFGNGACAYSLAFADFNKDGLLDLAVNNYNVDTVGVLLEFTFINGRRENECSTGSAPHPRAITRGHFDHDAFLDLAMVNYDQSTVSVLQGYGNGTYPSQTLLSTGVSSLPTSIATGHFNTDDQLDLVVANSANANIGIFFGDGNGRFAAQYTYSTRSGSVPQAVVVSDFNNDQRDDIAVADSGTNSAFVFVKYNVGAFEEQISFSTGFRSNPKFVSAADLDGDHRLDFVVANSGINTVGVFLGLGNGSFSSTSAYSTGINSYPRFTAIADMNNDGHLDLIVSLYRADRIGIFLGFGNGTFPSEMSHQTGYIDAPRSVGVADLNSDGHLDIAVAVTSDGTVRILYGSGDGSVSDGVVIGIDPDANPEVLQIGDLNKDGRPDIVVANYNTDSIGVSYGQGNGDFSPIMIYSTAAGSQPGGLSLGDFNNDGTMDIAVANAGSNTIGLFFGDGNSTFSDQVTWFTGHDSAPYAVDHGDFNKDGRLDLVFVNNADDTLGILIGCGNGTFFDPMFYSTGDYALSYGLAVGNFNNDGQLDVVVANAGADSVGVFFGYIMDGFLRAPLYSLGIASQPTSITSGDLDNDTRTDLVVSCNGTDNVIVLFGSGYGTFVRHSIYATGSGSQPSSVAVADLNNDNRSDIIVANSATDTIGVFLSSAKGIMAEPIILSTGARSRPYAVAVLDFDHDSRLDIAVANYGTSCVSVFRGDANGSFASPLDFYNGFRSHPYALTVGDVNNDDLTDILVTNNGFGNIDVITKTC